MPSSTSLLYISFSLSLFPSDYAGHTFIQQEHVTVNPISTLTTAFVRFPLPQSIELCPSPQTTLSAPSNTTHPPPRIIASACVDCDRCFYTPFTLPSYRLVFFSCSLFFLLLSKHINLLPFLTFSISISSFSNYLSLFFSSFSSPRVLFLQPHHRSRPCYPRTPRWPRPRDASAEQPGI